MMLRNSHQSQSSEAVVTKSSSHKTQGKTQSKKGSVFLSWNFRIKITSEEWSVLSVSFQFCRLTPFLFLSFLPFCHKIITDEKTKECRWQHSSSCETRRRRRLLTMIKSGCYCRVFWGNRYWSFEKRHGFSSQDHLETDNNFCSFIRCNNEKWNSFFCDKSLIFNSRREKRMRRGYTWRGLCSSLLLKLQETSEEDSSFETRQEILVKRTVHEKCFLAQRERERFSIARLLPVLSFPARLCVSSTFKEYYGLGSI